MGLLEAPSDIVPDTYLERAIRRYIPDDSESIDGLGSNIGISETLINRLISLKKYRYAYLLSKSSDSQSNYYLQHVYNHLKCRYLLKSKPLLRYTCIHGEMHYMNY